MFAGRKSEQRELEELYHNNNAKLIVLYGRAGIGKTELIRQFIQNKTAFYYQAAACTKTQQLSLMTLLVQLRQQSTAYGKTESISEADSEKDLNYQSTDALLKAYVQDCAERKLKPLMIFDEFTLMLENEPDFADTIKALMENQTYEAGLMIVLISSSIRWVENDMVGEQPMLSRLISHFMKLKELSLADSVHILTGADKETCICLYSFLGGIPVYLSRCHGNESVKQNLIRLMVHKDAELKNEAEALLKAELRELGSYNSILACMAAGKYKMNEIHQETGFSRAKISVYLKCLISLGVVEKLFSFDTKKQEQVQKGLYRICDPFLAFWYRFIFPYQSFLMMGKEEQFYNLIIKTQMSDYMKHCFPKVCVEYLKVLQYRHKLPFHFTSCKSWYGKKGQIDIIAGNSSKQYLAGQCLWSEEPMEAVVLSMVRSLCSKAGIRVSLVFLFSKSGFTKELCQQAEKEKNVRLIGLNEL